MTDSIQILKPGWRAFDANGDILSGAVLSFFDAGTSNTRTVYSNYGLSTSLGTTVTCDSGGFPTSDGSSKVEVYTGTSAYKVTLKDSSANTVWTIDNIVGALDTSPFAAASFAIPDTDCASDTGDTTLTTGMLGTVRNGNPTGGSFTYTLPSAITASNGRGYTIRHVGTAGTITIASVLSQTIDGLTSRSISGQYESITIVSDGANWHIEHDANRSIVGGTFAPEGYLTLINSVSSANPILAADVAAATAVYYTPFTGNRVPIYNGTRYVSYEFSELTLTLASQHAANTIYDVFAFLNNNAVTIGTGPAWSVSTAGSGARGTGVGSTDVQRNKGIYTNANTMTARNSSTTYTVSTQLGTYLGSILIDGTAGQVSCHVTHGQSRKWGVWNAFNRQPITLQMGDATASWSYSTATTRQSNGAAGNTVALLSGLPEERVYVDFGQNVRMSANVLANATNGIGVNSTTTMSGKTGRSSPPAISPQGLVSDVTAYHVIAPFIGRYDVNSLEIASGTATTEWFGTEAFMKLVAQFRG